MDEWVNEDRVYPHNAKSFSKDKQRSSDICYKVDESWKHYAQWKKPATEAHILYNSFIGKSIETESGLVVARGRDGEHRVF